MMPLSQPILIVAHSGRLLAQAAHAIGWSALVIDCFGDLDTQHYAQKCYQIPALAITHLTPVIEQLKQHYAVAAVIYGSGFENYPESLYFLAGQFRILGNDPGVFCQLLDKVNFFKQLDQLAIAHPPVSFKPPDDKGWLIKPMQGQGGVGVKVYIPGAYYPENTAVYWQRYQTGVSHSVLFLAGQGDVRVIGFNSQWCVEGDDKQLFLFAGIHNQAELSHEQKRVILTWLQKLVVAFCLKGLNTLDFIVDEGQCFLLEINPRPSASMQLYPAAWLLAHIQACYGEMHGVEVENEGICRGYQVVYKAQQLEVPVHFDWPAGCADLPKGGTIIATTQPICSIIAHGQCWQEVKALLQMRQQLLLCKLTKCV